MVGRRKDNNTRERGVYPGFAGVALYLCIPPSIQNFQKGVFPPWAMLTKYVYILRK